MSLFSSVESWLQALSQVVPLEAFVFIGSFLEEIISPIPSTLIMGLAGSMAAADAKTLLFLVWLSFIGNIGKTIGAMFYYFLGDKLEDVATKKIGKFFGVTHHQIERIGKKFTGHWRDGFILFGFRIVPFFPTTPISIVCGMIKMQKQTFILATFAGNFIKDFFYLLIGFTGIVAVRKFFHGVVGVKQYVDIAVFLGVVIFLYLLYYHRKKGYWLWQRFICHYDRRKTEWRRTRKERRGIEDKKG